MGSLPRDGWDPLAGVPAPIRRQLKQFSYRRLVNEKICENGVEKTKNESILFLWLRDGIVCVFRHMYPPVRPLVNPPLTANKVSTIVFGGQHYLGLNAGGVMWSWGDNKQGQLGLGHRDSIRQPKQIPFDQKVAVIKAGDTFSMVLTNKAHVYFWGRLVVSASDVNNDRHLYRRPKLVADLHFVHKIAAGKVHALALTSQGYVYAWGGNDQGQLGRLDHQEVVFKPGKIAGHDKFRCKAIAAGDRFSLVLTLHDTVYQLGYMCRADVELKDTQQSNIFTIELNEPVVAIEAHEDLAILQGASGHCYVLQRDLNAHRRLPVKTMFITMAETWAHLQPCLSSKTHTYTGRRPVEFVRTSDELERPCLWADLFDRPELSDLVVLVVQDDRKIFVQQSVLRQRSYVIDKLLDVYLEVSPSVLSITAYHYQTVHLFLRYIYIDHWCAAMIDKDLEQLPLFFLIELYNLAGEYCEEQLQAKCQHYLAFRIDASNCRSVLDVAKETHMVWLEDMAAKFISNDGGGQQMNGGGDSGSDKENIGDISNKGLSSSKLARKRKASVDSNLTKKSSF